MTDAAEAMLATLARHEQRAVDTRDRMHRRAKALRGAMTAIRLGHDPEIIAFTLKRRGVNLEETP